MTRWGSLAAAWLAGLVLATGVAAQNVPLPVPAPRPKGDAASQQPTAAQPRPPSPIPLSPGTPARQPASATTNQGPTIAPKPPVFVGQPGETTAFDAKQRILVDRISNYLSNVRALTGDFVQVGPDGGKTDGEFYLQKPGRVRFDYNPPSPIELIADGSSVVVRDRRLATQDLYPLSQTPLRFLLADQIDLLRDTNVIAVYADDVFATVVIEERQIIGGTHRLMLMFSAKDYQLKQWTVTDPQGYDTTVAISNLDSKSRPDASLFKIDFTRNIQ
jgi:outer membrane lipoprotein-sorting protein